MLLDLKLHKSLQNLSKNALTSNHRNQHLFKNYLAHKIIKDQNDESMKLKFDSDKINQNKQNNNSL